MLNISIEIYRYAEVDIMENNGELFWVKMNDEKKGLGIKNMSDLVKKEIHGVYGTKVLYSN